MPGLLELALEAHGGVDRWERVSQIRVRLDSGGLALASKWKPRALRGLEAAVSTKTPRTVLEGFPRAGMRGVFQPDSSRLESAGGEVVALRDHPRSAFRGLRHALWWDDLDVLYFAGYALWNYLTAPFLLSGPGVETRELEPADGRWRRLEVRFPPQVPTHSRTQVFHFDEAGLLRRLDYTAEIFGGWAVRRTTAMGTGRSTASRWPPGGACFPGGAAAHRSPAPPWCGSGLDDIRLT